MKKRRKTPDTYPKLYECFGSPDHWMATAAYQNSPSCFNGIPRLRRYRMTVELIDEPKEVLVEWLRDMWRACDNLHHWNFLRVAAKELGIKLDPAEVGKDRKG